MTRSRRVPTDAERAAADWAKAEGRAGKHAARRVVALGTVGVVLALAQAWCIALVLGPLVASLTTAPRAAALAHPWAPLFGFTVAALLRAAVQFAGRDPPPRRSARTPAGALRTDGLGRVLAAGPAALRGRATGDLVTLLVDGVGRPRRLLRALAAVRRLAIAGPLIVLLAVVLVDWRAALVLLAAGLLVPVLQAVFGIGAAQASRRQFTALSRLQVRFLDRMRGIGTLVLSGAEAREAASLGRAADELRMRTMRILRVAFLSSTALDLALVASLVAIALLDGARCSVIRARCGRRPRCSR